MTARRDVRINLADLSEMNMTVPEALDWLRKLAAKIPPEFADRSVFRAEYESDYYGGGSLEIEVYYIRPETDEEMRKRHEQDAANAAAARALNDQREREIYEHLRRKFG